MEESWVQRFRNIAKKQRSTLTEASITEDHRLILKRRDQSSIDAGPIKVKLPGSIVTISSDVSITEPDIYVTKDGAVWHAAASEGRYQGGTHSTPDAACWTGDRFMVPVYMYDSYSNMLQSRDGGTWVFHPDKVTFNPTTNARINGMAASGTGLVVAVGYGFGEDENAVLTVSYDFGETWVVFPTLDLDPPMFPYSPPTLAGVCVKNEFEWTITDGIYVWYTFDGGGHWSEVIYPNDFQINNSYGSGMKWFNGYWWFYGQTYAGTDEWDTPLIKSIDLVNWFPVVTPWSGTYPPFGTYLEVNAADVIEMTLLTQATFDTGTASWVTGSYTPVPNSLLLAFIETAGFSTDPPASITANGLTWHLVDAVAYNATVTALWVYRAMGPSPTSGSMTVVPGYIGQYGQIHIIQAENVSLDGSDGSGAIGNYDDNRADESSSDPAGSSLTITISGSSDKKIIVAGIVNTLNPGVTISPGSFCAGLGSTIQNLAVHRSMRTEWKKTTGLTINASVPGSTTQWMGVAIELVPNPDYAIHNNSSGYINILECDPLTNTMIANGDGPVTNTSVMMSDDGGEHWFEVGYLIDAHVVEDYGYEGIYKWLIDWYFESGGGMAYGYGWWFLLNGGVTPDNNWPAMIRISPSGQISEPVYPSEQVLRTAFIILSGGDVTF